ncbi:MAG TPA: hypothetical protein VND96_01740 [Candidatus Micrarchaeaceae archaeon]|nr:hypothetical protein [Candidatus Micrarchaeaceae archaeon]
MTENVALAVALIAVLGSLAGVWIGWRLGRAERVEQWRRDQQIAAYSELVAANVEVGQAYALVFVAETYEEHGEAARETAASVVRFHNATHRARIVASHSVRPVVDELYRLTTEATDELKKVKAERNERAADDNLVAAVAVREAISEQAREDFGFAGGRVRRWLRMRPNIRTAGPALSTDSEAR